MITYMVEKMMIPFLNFSYTSIFPNYGVAIILLTLVIKAAFYPLTKKQFESMKVTRRLQPKVKELQAKYKDNPQQMHQEMMKLWKENNANPLSGCLPALVQLPFFFAIFYTVNSDAFKVILKGPGVNPGLFPFWLSDLGLPDPFYVLPVLIGVSTYFSQKMMITDEKQAKLMMFLPVIMVVICLKMPAGVLLYWAASQLVSSAQQYYILRNES